MLSPGCPSKPLSAWSRFLRCFRISWVFREDHNWKRISEKPLQITRWGEKSIWKYATPTLRRFSAAFLIEKWEFVWFSVCIFSQNMISYDIEGADVLRPCFFCAVWKPLYFSKCARNRPSWLCICYGVVEMWPVGLCFHILLGASVHIVAGSWSDLSRSA